METARKIMNRAGKGILLASVLTCIILLARHYMPYPTGTGIRVAIYVVASLLCISGIINPLLSLAILVFAAPLLNIVPLYYTSGSTYPILIFVSTGFICGWLAHTLFFERKQTDREQELPGFAGAQWLYLFAAAVIISAGFSFFRYCPSWVWSSPELLEQWVNTKHMTREAATRFLLFEWANVMVWILLILATYNTIQRSSRRGFKVIDILVWALLFGGAGAALVAIYQGYVDIKFCANTSYYWIRLKRANGSCSDPNALGTLLGLCLSIAGMKVFYSGSWKSWWPWTQRILALVMCIVYVLGIKFSGSRSGLLAGLLTMAGIIIVVFISLDKLLRHIRTPVWVRGLVLCIGMCLCVGSFKILPWGINTFDKKITVSSKSSSLIRRLKRDIRKYRNKGGLKGVFNDPRRKRYWTYAEEMITEHPFTGVGLGAYVIELSNEAASRNAELRRIDNACNYYLHYFSELGIPGIAALGLFYGTLIAGMFLVIVRWYSLGREQQHLMITLGIPFVIFMITLIFGVHVINTEVNITWAVFLGILAAALAWTGMRPKKTAPRRRYIIVGISVGLLGLYLFAVIWNSHHRFDTERRIAACGIDGEFGWHNWERWKGVPFRHRWMGKRAVATVPRKNMTIGIPIVSNNPLITNNPQKVTFYLNGSKAREFELTKPGKWELIQLPVRYADAFQQYIEPCTALRIEVDRTWIPMEITGETDTRNLGIVVGEFRWQAPAQEMGGWYRSNLWDNTIPFRWSKEYAWRKLHISTNRFMEIPMYASNVLLRYWPLNAALYLNGHYLDTVTFNDKQWKNYRYPLPDTVKAGTNNIIEFITSRTWVPKHYGFDDKRELGVAVGDITFK
jgi:O-antigen ligase